MRQTEQNKDVPRSQVIAIRIARRYLKRNTESLARVLNAYQSAAHTGTQIGFLPEQ